MGQLVQQISGKEAADQRADGVHHYYEGYLSNADSYQVLQVQQSGSNNPDSQTKYLKKT